jgi:hypothetical protein
MQRPPWTRYLSGLTLPLLLVSVGLNAMQSTKIRDLTHPTGLSGPGVGQRVGTLAGVDADGRPRMVAFTASVPTVLYFFSPTCKWCERNWANVAAIARSSDGRYRFVAITQATDLRGFAATRGLSFDILGGVSADTVRALGLGGTPTTLVVSSQGTITHAWVGGFDGRLKADAATFFGVGLPGLQPAGPVARPQP